PSRAGYKIHCTSRARGVRSRSRKLQCRLPDLVRFVEIDALFDSLTPRKRLYCGGLKNALSLVERCDTARLSGSSPLFFEPLSRTGCFWLKACKESVFQAQSRTHRRRVGAMRRILAILSTSLVGEVARPKGR